jgi:hypothetical protein
VQWQYKLRTTTGNTPLQQPPAAATTDNKTTKTTKTKHTPVLRSHHTTRVFVRAT